MYHRNPFIVIRNFTELLKYVFFIQNQIFRTFFDFFEKINHRRNNIILLYKSPYTDYIYIYHNNVDNE